MHGLMPAAPLDITPLETRPTLGQSSFTAVADSDRGPPKPAGISAAAAAHPSVVQPILGQQDQHLQAYSSLAAPAFLQQQSQSQLQVGVPSGDMKTAPMGLFQFGMLPTPFAQPGTTQAIQSHGMSHGNPLPNPASQGLDGGPAGVIGGPAHVHPARGNGPSQAA